MKVKEMSDEKLISELQYWFRVGRNEDGLKGEERKFFRAVCNELAERGVLSRRKKDSNGKK